jgi:hypothetical protein
MGGAARSDLWWFSRDDPASAAKNNRHNDVSTIISPLPEHEEWARVLVRKYGLAGAIRLLKNCTTPAPKRSGRPTANEGNLAGVYMYIERHRREKKGGRILGVSGASKRLKKAIDRANVENLGITESRLRGMYYEVKRDAPKWYQKNLEALSIDLPLDQVPLPMKRLPDGSLDEPRRRQRK